MNPRTENGDFILSVDRALGVAAPRYGVAFHLVFTLLGVIALGSVWFHSTLHYGGTSLHAPGHSAYNILYKSIPNTLHNIIIEHYIIRKLYI